MNPTFSQICGINIACCYYFLSSPKVEKKFSFGQIYHICRFLVRLGCIITELHIIIIFLYTVVFSGFTSHIQSFVQTTRSTHCHHTPLTLFFIPRHFTPTVDLRLFQVSPSPSLPCPHSPSGPVEQLDLRTQSNRMDTPWSHRSIDLNTDAHSIQPVLSIVCLFTLVSVVCKWAYACVLFTQFVLPLWTHW